MSSRTSLGAPAVAAAVTASLLAASGATAQVPPRDLRERAADDRPDPCVVPWRKFTGSSSPETRGGRDRESRDLLQPVVRPPRPSTNRTERSRGNVRRSLRIPAGTLDDRGAASSRRSADGPSGSDRPNVVVVMVDDMRADELSGPWMQDTRRLMQSQGANFVNSFSPLPLCGPARASFLSGQYAHNTGVTDNASPSSYQRFDDRNTLPVWLQDAGYNTAYLGKYLNGYNRTNGEVPPGWDLWYGSLGGSTYKYWGTELSNNGEGTIDLSGRYQTTAYGDIGTQLISRLSQEKDPFYVNLAFTAPHTGFPREAGDPQLRTPATLPKTRGDYDDLIRRPSGASGEPCNSAKPAPVSGRKPLTRDKQRQVVSLARQRAEALATVDAQVQRLFETLRDTGELDNTYVLFTSDNGFFLGEFRRPKGKVLPYEPSLRTPTLVRGPGIDDGIERRQPFTTIDFAPTIADMAGVEPGRNVDGVSLLPSATGKDRGWKRPILTRSPWRHQDRFGRGVRVPGHLYAEYNDRRTSRELFDLRKDPGENHNVAGAPRYHRERQVLKRTLERLKDCRGDECRPRLRIEPGS